MYSKKEIFNTLLKNMEREWKAIHFYSKNLDRLNYKTNKKVVDKLIIESVVHLSWLTNEVLEMHKLNKCKLTKTMKDEARKEEMKMLEVYKREQKKAKDPSVQELLRKLTKEEQSHIALLKK